MKIEVGMLWEERSPLTPDYIRLHDALVPERGQCATMHGEALRCITKLYHDTWNNGGGNFDTSIMQYSAEFLTQWFIDPPMFLSNVDVEAVVRKVRIGVGTVLTNQGFLLALETVAHAMIERVKACCDVEPTAQEERAFLTIENIPQRASVTVIRTDVREASPLRRVAVLAGFSEGDTLTLEVPATDLRVLFSGPGSIPKPFIAFDITVNPCVDNRLTYSQPY